METVSTNASTPPKKNTLRKVITISTLLIALSFTIYYFICGMTYSEGTRSGILTKVSKKGYFFKTFEGELNIGGINQGDGTIMPNTVFRFSVYDEKTYHKLDSLQGRKVVVGYEQVIKNFFWQGESDYFVHSVRAMN